MKKNKNNKGFSLVELVIVVAILAILVGILAPQYTKYVERSRKSADASNIENIVTAIKVSAADQSYDIPSGTYVIKLTSAGCEIGITKDTNITGTIDNVLSALTEYLGKNAFSKNGSDGVKTETIKMKSSKWGADNITTTIKIEKSGAVAVQSYTPTGFNTFMTTGKEADN